MGSKSDYLENKILDHILGGPDFARPATLYVALYTVSPNDAGGGVEVSGGSYARVAVTNNLTNFPAASGSAKSNGTAIVFPQATADWGTIVAVAVLDAATAGNFLFAADLDVAKPIFNGDTAEFAAASLNFAED